MFFLKTRAWLGNVLQGRKSTARRRSVRPALEQLEDRVALSGLQPQVIRAAEPGIDGRSIIDGRERVPLTNITVATFYGDPFIGAFAPTYTATINWGDGVISPGTIVPDTPSPGIFSIVGSHTYMEEPLRNGEYVIGVGVSDGTNSVGTGVIALIHQELLPDGTQGTANQNWVCEVYRDLLHRQVDSAGLAAWSGLLDHGASRAEVIREIQECPDNEYRTVQVQSLYNQYLRRAADPTGLANSVAFLQMGGTIEQLAAAIASSPEYFQNRGGGTNSGFLAALYQDALGRPIDSAASATWGSALAAGASRRQVALGIFTSIEYRQKIVDSYYVSFLDRSVFPDGGSSINALFYGARDEAVVASILASSEYYANATPRGPAVLLLVGRVPWPSPPPPPGIRPL
jgi:hypothetical protein